MKMNDFLKPLPFCKYLCKESSKHKHTHTWKIISMHIYAYWLYIAPIKLPLVVVVLLLVHTHGIPNCQGRATPFQWTGGGTGHSPPLTPTVRDYPTQKDHLHYHCGNGGILSQCIMHISLCKLHYAHCTLHIESFTLHLPNFILHIVSYILQLTRARPIHLEPILTACQRVYITKTR